MCVDQKATDVERIAAMRRLKTKERVEAVAVIIGSLTFVVMGALAVNFGDAGDNWTLWFCIAFFGTGFLAGICMLAETVERRLPNPSVILAKYRERFRRSLGGFWISYTDDDDEMSPGKAISFDEDGTGVLISWDNAESNDIKETFRWECIGDWSTKLTCEDRESIVSYDFKVWKDRYDTPVVQLYEPTPLTPELSGDEGFWRSPFPMIQVPENVAEPLNAYRRLWPW